MEKTQTNSENSRWWRLKCQSEAAEDDCFFCIEYGASGTEQLSHNQFITYFEGDRDALTEFMQRCSENGIEVLEQTEVPNENWLKNCQEIWQPLDIGKLRIVPVLEPKEVSTNPGEIYILPGTGFGTGHHETTSSVLRLLQSKKLAKPICKVLDLGSGSGILAFAASLLFNVKVDAIENDPLAVENAKQSQLLNPNTKVSFYLGELDSNFQGYDLILANIYAEVLCQLKEKIVNALDANGSLILSGIHTDKVSLIENAYLQSFKILEHCEEGNWNTYLLSR
ncbi:MAG: 50S ribosomal protein L11 methyltransferase [Deltaproteobacteria bacterium]|nr:50S ribosomal protein L11 methyltransferase [Deltaproteobacteria bacterium]